MKNLIRHVTTMLMLMVCLSSCVYDNLDEEPEQEPDKQTKLLSLNVSIPKMTGTRAADESNDGYKPGIDFENYIDLSADGFRVYIFNSQDKFITRLAPFGVITATETGNTETYTVIGVLPDDFPTDGNIKVAVLANWPAYNDGDLTPDVSTIDDLCKAEWGQFNRLTDFRLSEENNIPFFGIHEYTGLTFAPGERTVLPGEITLLRAMAKVELIINNASLSLQEATIRGINPKGYCAPAGVYSKTDYDHDGDWDLDYVKTVHLPGNSNGNSPETTSATLLRKNRHTGTERETWVCYVPEYKNLNNADGSANYKSRLELLFDTKEATGRQAEIYFVDYDADGQPITGTDHDICRNNYYRFIVNVKNDEMIIYSQKWNIRPQPPIDL